MPNAQGKMIVGLTGIFGSGKSTVSHLFEELGACVVNADKLAHEVLSPGRSAFPKIAALFPEAKTSQGDLDRKVIAKIIFSDAAKRQELEKISHPYVLARIQDEVTESEEEIVVVEVPLLFEAGFHEFCDTTITVSAAMNTIQERLREKGFSESQIRERLAAQLSLEEKIKRSDFVIQNSGSLKETKDQVARVWKQLQAGKVSAKKIAE